MSAVLTPVLEHGQTTAIAVTEEHILHGKAKSCEECPIALAIHAAIPGLEEIEVTDCVVRVCAAGRGWRAEMPRIGSAFTWRFDQGVHVDPFTFNLTWEAA